MQFSQAEEVELWTTGLIRIGRTSAPVMVWLVMTPEILTQTTPST
jgi:hypothetical protein